MLHAFNQKGVRRIFDRSEDEHGVEKTEDAVTSMVFTPLAFMPAKEALQCLQLVIGAPSRNVVGDRVPSSHSVELWPRGLQATSSEGSLTGCEPDLVASFSFDEEVVIFVGEFKWEWRPSHEALATQLKRQRAAIKRSTHSPICQFALGKYASAPRVAGVPFIRWIDVVARLRSFLKDSHPSVASTWAQLVATFLEKADVTTFGGFPCLQHVPADWRRDPAFWRGP